MAKTWSGKITHTGVKKGTSQGVGGRGRKVKINTSTMNKHRKRSYKKYFFNDTKITWSKSR